MKNFILIAALFLSVTACRQSTKKETDTYRQTPVQNVNGNIPDTTNSINLQTHEKDNTKVRDTTQ